MHSVRIDFASEIESISVELGIQYKSEVSSLGQMSLGPDLNYYLPNSYILNEKNS